MLTMIKEVMNEMERGVYNFTQDGECSNCGQCCSRFLPVSAKEVKNIKRYIQKNHIKEQKHFYPTAQPTDDWTCPFRSEKERKCLEVIRENVGEFQWEDNLKVWRVGCNHKYKSVPHEKFKSCEWLICEKCGNKQFVDFGD